jgi:hypothetical protein
MELSVALTFAVVFVPILKKKKKIKKRTLEKFKINLRNKQRCLSITAVFAKKMKRLKYILWQMQMTLCAPHVYMIRK